MPGIYGILNTGKNALMVQQLAIDVTGNNIANATTAGYSRQRVNLETNEPIAYQPGELGTGVKATEIQRIYDQFLGIQINSETQTLGKWEAQDDGLQKVEMIFNESTGYGLTEALSEFWNAWQDLANNPGGAAERTVAIAKAEDLATDFQQMATELDELQEDMDTNINGAIDEINLLSAQIAELNGKIVQTEVSGQNANDYRDERMLLLNQLSELTDITSFEGKDGQVTVLAGEGKPLVEGNFSWQLGTENNGSGLDNVVWIDSEGNSTDITGAITGGKLKGWLEVRDRYIPSYRDSLDELAGTIIDEVNGVHSAGFGLDGSTGNDFFTGSSASDIAVNSAVADDINLIAAASDINGIPGDNSNAMAIADLQNALIMSGGTATFDDYYNALVAKVGTDVEQTDSSLDFQTGMLDQLNSLEKAVSGVSLDEEMVNLVQFQHAYEAAAKLITLVDELLNTLMDMV